MQACKHICIMFYICATHKIEDKVNEPNFKGHWGRDTIQGTSKLCKDVIILSNALGGCKECSHNMLHSCNSPCILSVEAIVHLISIY